MGFRPYMEMAERWKRDQQDQCCVYWWFSGWYGWGDYENEKERTKMERDDDL